MKLLELVNVDKIMLKLCWVLLVAAALLDHGLIFYRRPVPSYESATLVINLSWIIFSFHQFDSLQRCLFVFFKFSCLRHFYELKRPALFLLERDSPWEAIT